MSKLRFKLVHKILALVLIPFFFNGLWVFLLNDALQRKDHPSIMVERSQAELLENLNNALQLFYDATGKLFEYQITQDRDTQQKGLKTMRKLKSLVYEKNWDTALSPSAKQGFIAFGDMMEKELSSLSMRDTIMEDRGAASFLKRVKETHILLRKSIKNSSALFNTIQQKKAELDQFRLDEQRTESNLLYIVLGGFAGNLLLVIAVTYFVITDFSKRLKVLMMNSERLGKRLPLTESPSGHDELNELDQTLRSAAKDLKEAFEFRASLMQMVAHDLRSPLQSSQISLEKLTEIAHEKLDEQGARQVDRLQANNSRLLALVEDLLTIDRLDAGTLELDLSPVSVRKAAAESILLMGGLATAADIRVINRCGDETAQADQRRLAQVFNNLISNAIKFSPPDSEIAITSKLDNDLVEVSISDHGVGMNEADSKRVFEKFFQADNAEKTKGSGLGLAICKLIIDSHKGRIGVESEPGKGSRFWFSLPKA